MTSAERARRVLVRADLLGEVSEEEGMLTRRFATAALGEAAGLVEGWMREAGLSVRRDMVGNVIGHKGGAGPPLVLGSHLDTVRDAGRFDGSLGVLCAIELADLRGAAASPLEVVAFADEEGVRFGVAYLGSAAYRGRFDPAWLELTDADGVTMAAALDAAGGNAAALRDPPSQQTVASGVAGAAGALIGGGSQQTVASVAPAGARELAGYIEVHIEQGPVLEAEDLPVGVVTAIAGQTRAMATFVGVAGHAGTVPPALRRDALAGAAELVLAVEAAARAGDGLVATVGALEVEPGASNVVPGRVVASLDVRHRDDAERSSTVAELERRSGAIATERGLGLDWRILQQTASVAMDVALTERLAAAIRARGLAVRELVSGAGHDAAIVGRDTPASMLFVRCAGGISHSPAERVSEDDVAVALDVLGSAFG